jgi:hypothetical protein
MGIVRALMVPVEDHLRMATHMKLVRKTVGGQVCCPVYFDAVSVIN